MRSAATDGLVAADGRVVTDGPVAADGVVVTGGPAATDADSVDAYIEAHLSELASALRGPSRLKSRMVAELREGLYDAMGDLSHGTHADHAAHDPHPARQAIDDFGTVAELAPSFQRELTIAQARLTARTLIAAVSLLSLGWYLLAHPTQLATHPLPRPTQLLLLHLGIVTTAAALLAAASLAATGALARHLPTPDRLPLLVSRTATTAAIALGLSALTLTATCVLTATWMQTAIAAAITVAFHTGVAASARACRTCARCFPA